jgi:RNA polymerase sigma-70 factor (ECF subfamily)
VLHTARAGQLLRGGGAAELLSRSDVAEVRVPITAEPIGEVHERLRAFVRRRVSDPHAAEDVAQEVLLRLHRNMGRLRDNDRLDAFAYEIARNAITDHYRARARARELPSAPDSLVARIDADPAGNQPVEDPEGRQMLARCLEPLVQQLPAAYREALTLTDLGDLSQVEACA